MTRTVGDLASLPSAGFRSHGLWYWAGLAFMLMEGAAFALAGAAYLYLMNGASQWPLDGRAPDLLWGTVQTALLLASLVPNLATSRAARRRDAPAARSMVALMAALAVASLVVRGLELPDLNTRWDYDAYGSIVWALILMHTLHLVTDFVDTFFLAVMLHTHPPCTERFSDADDNASYWAFVVVAWLPIYLLIYWAPRWSP